MKLVIFDLDQTLVDFIEIHNRVVQTLFKEFFAVDARLTEIDFTGRSLDDNFRELARLKNVPEGVFQKKSRQLLASYDAAFSKSLPADGARYVLPGVRELLDKLATTDHIVALYTGDSPAIVKDVFRVTGLGKYFRFCQYGTRVSARADMVKHIIEEARKLTGREFKGKDIVIIGDSLRDVECGKVFDALVIAVATGFHSQAQLSAAGPDYLFADLKNTQKVIRAIEGVLAR